MRIAVLSCGPSLLQVAPSDLIGFDQVIGVNRSVLRHNCHWWCFGDDETYEIVGPPLPSPDGGGAPGVFTMDIMAARLSDRHGDPKSPWHQHRLMTWQQPDVQRCAHAHGGGPVNWSTWSCTAALVLARYLGAQELHIFGADMAGEVDFTGHRCGARNSKRWAWEGEVFSDLLQWLNRCGTKTIHVQPAPARGLMEATPC